MPKSPGLGEKRGWPFPGTGTGQEGAALGGSWGLLDFGGLIPAGEPCRELALRFQTFTRKGGKSTATCFFNDRVLSYP